MAKRRKKKFTTLEKILMGVITAILSAIFLLLSGLGGVWFFFGSLNWGQERFGAGTLAIAGALIITVLIFFRKFQTETVLANKLSKKK